MAPLDGKLSDYLHPAPLPIAHPDTVRAVCLRAADIVEVEWGQGCAHAKGGLAPGQLGTTCLMLALRRAYKEVVGRSANLDNVELCKLVGFDYELAAFRWNDHPNRRLSDVTVLLRGTAGR